MPGLAISLISLGILLYISGPSKLLEALANANYWWVVLSIFITLLWLVVRSMAWRTLLQEKATLSQVFMTVNEGYLLNNVLPFRLGEIGRAFLLSRKANIGFWEVFSSILVERILDLAFAVGLLFSTLPFVFGASWAFQAAVTVGLIVFLGLFTLFLLARNREKAIGQFNKFAVRWPVLNKIGEQRIQAFFNGLAALNDSKRFLRVIGWMALNWLIALGQYYILLLAFFPEGRFIWAAFGLAAAAMGIAVPSSPGGVGVMEGAVVGALALFGQDASTALAFALVTHAVQFLVTNVLGVFGLVQDGISLTGIYQRASAGTPPDITEQPS